MDYSFNPCFIGTYSFTKATTDRNKDKSNVLILVLLELILLLYRTFEFDNSSGKF